MNENAKKWVAALRSGEYNQGCGLLKDGDSYCCLGVLACVYRKDTTTIPNDFTLNDLCEFDSLEFLPQVMEWAGLADPYGGVNKLIFGEDNLAKINDAGVPFVQIADIIESEPEGLFVE